jgi:hypothetical protein
MPLNIERDRCTGRVLRFREFIRRRLFSDQSADLVYEKERCGDEQCESDNRDRR